MIKCGKIVETPLGKFPCGSLHNHSRRHLADLTGYEFNDPAKNYIVEPVYSQNFHRICWKTVDKFGYEKTIPACSLTRKTSTFAIYPLGHPFSTKETEDGKTKVRPEYSTVQCHWRVHFDPKNRDFNTYSGRPFQPEWNPQCGGSWQTGMIWIIENLGTKSSFAVISNVPKSKVSLDCIHPEEGFVIGNLRWVASFTEQTRNRLPWIVADLRAEISVLRQEVACLKSQLLERQETS